MWISAIGCEKTDKNNVFIQSADKMYIIIGLWHDWWECILVCSSIAWKNNKGHAGTPTWPLESTLLFTAVA